MGLVVTCAAATIIFHSINIMQNQPDPEMGFVYYFLDRIDENKKQECDCHKRDNRFSFCLCVCVCVCVCH